MCSSEDPDYWSCTWHVFYWPVFLISWIFLNCAPMWLIIRKYRNIVPNAIRDQGYEAFVRKDYHKWSYFLTFFTHSFFIPRFLIAWLAITIIGLGGSSIVNIGYKPGTKKHHVRQLLTTTFIALASRIALFTMGIFFIKKEKI